MSKSDFGVGTIVSRKRECFWIFFNRLYYEKSVVRLFIYYSNKFCLVLLNIWTIWFREYFMSLNHFKYFFITFSSQWSFTFWIFIIYSFFIYWTWSNDSLLFFNFCINILEKSNIQYLCQYLLFGCLLFFVIESLLAPSWLLSCSLQVWFFQYIIKIKLINKIDFNIN